MELYLNVYGTPFVCQSNGDLSESPLKTWAQLVISHHMDKISRLGSTKARKLVFPVCCVFIARLNFILVGLSWGKQLVATPFWRLPMSSRQLADLSSLDLHCKGCPGSPLGASLPFFCHGPCCPFVLV